MPDYRSLHPRDLAFERPHWKTLWRLTALHRAWFSTEFRGLENIDADRPALLVGNHTIYGVLDIPLLLAQLYREREVLPRSLGDDCHFLFPVWPEVIRSFGAVPGSRENCSTLMKAGEHILVFPGGGREVYKRRGEAYKLIWKERLGFVRLAVEHGYPIIPFAQVGAEEAYDILFDADDVLASPFAPFLKRIGLLDTRLRGGDAIPPLALGLAGTLLPRRVPLRFGIGKPIDTAGVDAENEASLRQLRDTVEAAIQGIMVELGVEAGDDTVPR